jgi:hypothetical protein
MCYRRGVFTLAAKATQRVEGYWQAQETAVKSGLIAGEIL